MKRFKKKKEESVTQAITAPMLVAIIVLCVLAFLIMFVPVFSKYDPDKIDLMNILQQPSASHLLGTDNVGRDQFTRLLYGGRTSLLNAFLVVVLAMILGIPMGLVSGYYGGKIDALWMRICDFILAFPVLLLAFVLVIALGRGGHIAVVAIAIVYTPGISKLARSLIMTEKTKGYVETCKSVSFSDARIIFKHIMPNCIPTMVAELTLDFSAAIVTLTSLSFLGLGVQPPQADWGCMLNESMASVFGNPALTIGPAVAIILVAISLNILSDGIMMYLDPDQRKVPSFKKYERRLQRKRRNA